MLAARPPLRPALAVPRAQADGLGYALLYLPVVVAWLVADLPVASYAVAWTGSLWIFWLTLSGRVAPLPDGVPLLAQIMRPIGFTQLVFASYMALTSVFLMLDVLGVSPGFERTAYNVDAAALAEAQRYYVLGHAALATGILWAMDYGTSGRWRVVVSGPMPRWLLWVAAGTLGGSFVIGALPGLGQVASRFQTFSMVASVLALALSLPDRRVGALLAGGAVYGVNMAQALLSGWKEEVLVLLLLLGVFVYPYYRAAVLLTAPVVLGTFLLLVPTYNMAFRELNWEGTMDARTAAAAAAEVVRDNQDNLAVTSWEFLTQRMTEAGMFTRYIAGTPEHFPFRGLEIPLRAAAMVTPRALWPEKPLAEPVVMERVYEHGIVSHRSEVSAKPHFVVDGYLSGGAFGVWLACLVYGLVASWASRLCERWFGGYLIGSALVYTALFQALWRGNSFEFLANTLVWSFVLAAGLFAAGRFTGLIVPAGDAA